MSAGKPIAEVIGPLEMLVEKHIKQAVGLFQNLDAETLLKQPHEAGWSISQCLWHLNSYGFFYLPHISKALASATERNVYSSGWLGACFIRIMGPGKQKFTAFKDHTPPNQPDAYAVVAEFIEQQETLLKYLKQAHKADLNKRLPISISTFVTLRLGDVLQFVVAHDERHMQQALRNLPTQ
jgi:uncharacterized damage-inducible protein DinB